VNGLQTIVENFLANHITLGQVVFGVFTFICGWKLKK